MAARLRKVFSPDTPQTQQQELQPLTTSLSTNNINNNDTSVTSPKISPINTLPSNPQILTTTHTTTIAPHHPSSSQSINNKNAFNPRLIFAQIAALQSIHYLVLSIFFQVNGVVWGTSITVDRIFTAEYLNVWTREGWIDNGAILMSSVVGAFLLAFIVEKSKKCLDFSVTLFSIHLTLCSLFDGKIPRSWDWWIIHILGMIGMIVLGEYLCSRVEMRDIPLLL